MRLSSEQTQKIRQIVRELVGEKAQVRLFGSRLDDQRKGGDVDLLLELPEPVADPALVGARLSARISRALIGRRVDVLILAPNLRRLPIHEIALSEGKIL